MQRIDSLWLFPYFQTREAAAKAGYLLAEYDPTRPVKKWFDPRQARIYAFALAVEDNKRALPKKSEDGKPYLEQLVLDRADAAGMNIPPDVSNYPAVDAAEIQCPVRPLTATEFLDFIGMAGEVWVIDKADVKPTDRELLEKILKVQEEILAKLVK